jgi:nucleoside 2-deoxyribosyltransferase
MAPIRIYLAGPEVFLKNAKEVGEQKKALCRKYGFEGMFPWTMK